jgi:hypothetical protein
MAQHTAGPAQVRLVLRADADSRELEALTGKLRRELLALDVKAVERPPAGRAPAGTRAVDLVAIGTLVVTLGKSAAALAPVVAAVRSWLATLGTGSVEIQDKDGSVVKVSGRLSARQEALIDRWLAARERRSREAGPRRSAKTRARR